MSHKAWCLGAKLKDRSICLVFFTLLRKIWLKAKESSREIWEQLSKTGHQKTEATVHSGTLPQVLLSRPALWPSWTLWLGSELEERRGTKQHNRWDAEMCYQTEAKGVNGDHGCHSKISERSRPLGEGSKWLEETTSPFSSPRGGDPEEL